MLCDCVYPVSKGAQSCSAVCKHVTVTAHSPHNHLVVTGLCTHYTQHSLSSVCFFMVFDRVDTPSQEKLPIQRQKAEDCLHKFACLSHAENLQTFQFQSSSSTLVLQQIVELAVNILELAVNSAALWEIRIETFTCYDSVRWLCNEYKHSFD